MSASGTGQSSGGVTRPLNQARVERVFDHNADTRSLFLRVVEGRLAPFVPGQFISVSIPLADETRSRPYTIASAFEDGEPIEICFNRVPGGRGVDHLFERRVGDLLAFTGPFGLFTLETPPAAELVFIAAGTAIAPIRPMIRRALAHPPGRPLHLLYAAIDERHLLYRGDLEAFARDAAFGLEMLTLASGATAHDLWKKVAEIAERRWVKGDRDRTRHFYICGVGAGVLRLRDLLRGAGYQRRAVHYEQW